MGVYIGSKVSHLTGCGFDSIQPAAWELSNDGCLLSGMVASFTVGRRKETESLHNLSFFSPPAHTHLAVRLQRDSQTGGEDSLRVRLDTPRPSVDHLRPPPRPREGLL